MWFKRKIDELSIERMKKDTNFDNETIVLGNGISEYSKIRCGNCGEVMNSFGKVYSHAEHEVIPGCSKCGKDISDTTFYPLNEAGKVIM